MYVFTIVILELGFRDYSRGIVSKELLVEFLEEGWTGVCRCSQIISIVSSPGTLGKRFYISSNAKVLHVGFLAFKTRRNSFVQTTTSSSSSSLYLLIPQQHLSIMPLKSATTSLQPPQFRAILFNSAYVVPAAIPEDIHQHASHAQLCRTLRRRCRCLKISLTFL